MASYLNSVAYYNDGGGGGTSSTATTTGYSAGGSGGPGGWTFIADSDNQLALADALNQAADNFDARKNEMYGKIDNMGNHWKGGDYDLFNSSAHNYDGALKAFSDSIRMYGTQFEGISGATEQLSSELIEIIMNMTGSGTAGGGNISIPGGGGNVTLPGGGTTTNPGGGTTTNPGGGTTNNPNTSTNSSGGAYGIGDPAAGAVNGAVAGATAGAVAAAGEKTSGFTNWFGNNSYWQNIGSDYAENYDFSNANSAFDYVWEGVGGTVETVVDAAQTVGNAAFDGVNWVLDGAQWILNGNWGGYENTQVSSKDPATISNPYDNAYWKNLGSDFAENYNFSNADSVFDYAWEAVGGTVETVYDGAMVVVNGVVDTAQGAVEVVEWAWNGLLDFLV